MARNEYSNLPDPSSNTAQVGVSFPVKDLHFAMAWSKVAPGLGGWGVLVSDMTTGEVIEITPPGAEYPVFYVMPRSNGVEIIRERPIEVGGGQISVARLPGLREAVLLLCPLSREGLAEIERLTRTQRLRR